MSIAYKISKYNRDRKWRLFIRKFPPDPNRRVLDVGFSEKEYSATDNYIEKHYPFPHMLTALGVNEPVQFKARYPAVHAVHYDGTVFPFADSTFDVVWSNAVIEHVGDRARQLFFIREIRRVATSAFITTPNRFFPIEVHTRTPLFHFLPKRMFDKYLTMAGKKWATGDYMHLLSLQNIKSLLADADITKYKIWKNKLAGFTLDFVISWEKQ